MCVCLGLASHLFFLSESLSPSETAMSWLLTRGYSLLLLQIHSQIALTLWSKDSLLNGLRSQERSRQPASSAPGRTRKVGPWWKGRMFWGRGQELGKSGTIGIRDFEAFWVLSSLATSVNLFPQSLNYIILQSYLRRQGGVRVGPMATVMTARSSLSRVFV